MPILIKPRTLGLLTKVERQPPGASLIVSAFAMFDLADPNPYRLEGDQGLWLLVAKEMPRGAVFDICMPKPAAEVLIAGHAAGPHEQPVQRMMLGWAIGGHMKQLLVTGDRYWHAVKGGFVPTEPTPFLQMPLDPTRVFGGPGHAFSPTGTGYAAERRIAGGELVALPNVEIPDQAIRYIGDMPRPARFGPLAPDSKERRQYAGTYDGEWLKTRAPALAADVDPRLFMFAPFDQRLPDFLAGDEPYALLNFAADAPEIRARLPGFRVRCFVGWTDRDKPVTELATRIDTLWLFAGARRGVLVYRAAVPVEDIEGADVSDIMVAYERADGERRSTGHYLDTRRLRLDPEQAIKYAFADHQLAPILPQSEVERRVAKRREVAVERRRRMRENMQWIAAKELERSGVPKELHPVLDMSETDEVDVPLPLAEEIESGEIDLAEILDAIEELTTKKYAELDKLKKDVEPMAGVLQGITSGTAQPGDIDTLLAALGQPDGPGQIDTALAQVPKSSDVPTPAPDPAAAPAPPADLSGVDALLAQATDWRQAILDAASPKVDEQEQFMLARARFLGLPEGRPMEAIRQALSQSAAFPELPPFETSSLPAATAADVAPLDAALRALESDPNIPPNAAELLKSGLAAADAGIAKAAPRLAGGVRPPIQNLLALAPERPPLPASGDPVAGAKAAVEQNLAVARAEIERAEEQLAPALAQARLASPVPTQPDVPLTPAVARALGDLVVQQFRAGLALAGRDLAGADLTGADLSGADLSGAFLERARLDGARLLGANLANATLCGASLVNADLSRCDLTKANLCSIKGQGARFAGSRLDETTLFDAELQQACFDGAVLHRLALMTAPLTACSFRGAHLSESVFMRNDLTESQWDQVQIERVQFMDLPLDRSSFRNARFHEVAFLKVPAAGADFSGSVLSSVIFAADVDLSGARFSGISITNLTFQASKLVDADLSNSRLDGICFVGSDLTRANFRLSSLKNAVLSRNMLRGADLFAANLLQAQLNRADLSGASFCAANLYGADLMDAQLVAADLSRANLNKTILQVPTDVA